MNTKLISIQIGQPQTYSDEQGTWETAFFKEVIYSPIFLGTLGLAGDAVANTQHHGGADQAVLLYSADHYPPWQSELGQDLPFGAFAENLTVSGLDETNVCIGDVYQIGEVQLQVTKPRIPCWKIARRWGIPDLTKRVTQSNRMGWYCRVLKEGEIETGLTVEMLKRDNPEQTVAQIFQEYLQGKEKSN
jgi:MOSC domain-containing protein YiiM